MSHLVKVLYICAVLKANKYRLYPSDSQKELLDKHFGSVRFIFNLALETKTWAYSTQKVNISRYELQVQLKDLKEECVWLKEVNSQSLQVALLNLETAYINFFKGRGKFPNFKKRSGKQSFLCPQKVMIKNGGLYIPKFREGIKIILHRSIKGIIKSATLSKTATDKYFVSILTETKEVIPYKKEIDPNSTVGIDLGIKTFAVLSDGTEFENPKYLNHSLQRLKVLQRRSSRKIKGSNNKKKSLKRVAKLHEKITNQRKDFLHKVTDAITKQYDTICVEDLAVSNLMKNHKLARSISDAGWGVFGTFLQYKADWRGNNVLGIDRFEPSSKLHNTCGYINKNLLLSDREWTCPNCGNIVLRDVNAAINIKNFALIKHSGVERTVEPAELPTLVGALNQEKFVIKRLA